MQALADLAAGDELAFGAGVRRAVDHEGHVQRRLIDLEHRQRLGRAHVGQRAADRKLIDAGHQHNVAGHGFFKRHALNALETEDLIDLGILRRAVRELAVGIGLAVHHRHLLRRFDAAALNAADADAADIRGIIERRDLQLQRAVDVIGLGRRHVLEDSLEHRAHVGRRRLEFGLGVAVDRRGVDDREVELLVAGAELVEEVEGLVDDPVRARTVAVNLVDHHDRLEAQGQRLLGHEAGLRHRAFDSIDEKQHAVDHAQHALDLATEVSVPRGVDDVDVHTLVIDRQVLGQDGDAPLLFEVVRIHHALGDVLVRGEGAGLLQELVDEGGLAVVDVGNDGDVTDGTGHFWAKTLKRAVILAQRTRRRHMRARPIENERSAPGAKKGTKGSASTPAPRLRTTSGRDRAQRHTSLGCATDRPSRLAGRTGVDGRPRRIRRALADRHVRPRP